MKIIQQDIISELIELTRTLNNRVELFKSSKTTQLNFKTNPSSWSALECLEHLNLYGEFYLPEIGNQIKKSNTKSKQHYTAGILGNYFANLMQYKETKMKKMKSPKDKNPLNSNLSLEVIDKFQSQLNELLNLLERSKSVDLGKIKCSISISPFIKLKLGDTLRFYVYHMERHIIQAEKTLKLNP